MADNLEGPVSKELVLSSLNRCLLVKWKVAANQKVSKGTILAVYKKICSNFPSESDLIVLPKLKSDVGGLIKRLLVAEGEEVQPGQAVILLNVCQHKTVMKDMCAECGADLRREPGIPGNLKEPVSASVALVHNIPELRVSQEEAETLAKKDKETLLKSEKLVLLVDLDQTLIHTTTENVPADMKDVYHFQLHGQNCWYHTKFRPGWKMFLEDMSKFYELHIFTMGSRMYAHTIARMLDPTQELFADRIRSRDESFDMFSKYRDLSALFPCDDSMVCIIDDREDIWDCAPNLITVKPYRFFTGTGDINAPPGSDQAFTHPSAIPLHESTAEVEMKNAVSDGDTKSINKVEVVLKYSNQTVSPKAENEIRDNESSMDTHSVSENSTSDGASVAVINTNHNGDLPDKPSDTIKPDFCNVCETVSKVYTTEHLKEHKDNNSSNEIQEATETGNEVVNKEKDFTEKAIVNPIAEEEMTVDGSEEKEKGSERSGDREAGEIVDDQGEEVNISERGALEDRGNGFDVVEGKRSEHEETAVEKKHEEDPDDYLLYLEGILRRIHERFYEIAACCKKSNTYGSKSRVNSPPDLRCIVPELRSDVLKDTNVVFTGVIPTNCRHEDSQAWKIALQFGASVSRDLKTRKNTADRSMRTTHVIAARPGTEKACQTLRLPNVKLVNPNWLWTCAERWELVDERLFPVEDYEKSKTQRNETPPTSRRATPKRPLLNEDGDISSESSLREVEDSFKAWESVNRSDRFKDALNPFLSFSSGEMEAMDKEVEDLMRSSEGEEEDDEEDREILGSISSSSSENGYNRVASDKSTKIKRGLAEQENNIADIALKAPKAVDFFTIKQTLDRQDAAETLTKRRKLDFCADNVQPTLKKVKSDDDDDADIGAMFSTDEESTGSSSADEDDNDMAAMLEAAVYHS